MKIILRYVAPVQGGSEVCIVADCFSGDEEKESQTLEYLISAEQYGELSFLWPAAKAAGRGITTEQADALSDAADFYAAFRRGISLLAYGDTTVHRLLDKLRARGIDRELAQRAAAALAERGYIDEKKQLRRTAALCLRKGWGKKRIAAACMEKRFSRETLEELDGLLADVDFPAACAAVIERRWGELPADPAERRRAVASLGRLGYSWDDIKAAERMCREAL